VKTRSADDQCLGEDWQIAESATMPSTRASKSRCATVYLSFRQYSRETRISLCERRCRRCPRECGAQAMAGIVPNVPLSNITTRKWCATEPSARSVPGHAGQCPRESCVASLVRRSIWIDGVSRGAPDQRDRHAHGAGRHRRHIAGRSWARRCCSRSPAWPRVCPPPGLTRLIKSQLYGVQPNDPFTLVAAVVALWSSR